jgi:hypothetical protein
MSGMRRGRWAFVLVWMVGCGAGASPAAVAPTAHESATATATATATAAPALVLGGPVSWNLGQALRVDERGVVFGGEGDSSRMGELTTSGEMIVDGEVAARIAADGTVTVDGEVSSFRVVDDGIVDTSAASEGGAAPRVLHLERSELVSDMDARGERIPLAGFRPELTREVLFLSTVMLVGMTR